MPTRDRRLVVGVIGCGHWGPNHVRVFSELERSTVRACADTNADRLERIKKRFPQIGVTTDPIGVLADDAVSAVAIATPTCTHAGLVRRALRAGKHVLVEKPLCTESAEAHALARMAEEAGLVLMVGHVFLYNSGIVALRDAIERGALGRIQYLDAVRTNLGPIRHDANAFCDLGSHDVSIFNYLMGRAPTSVSALGQCILQPAVEDVCFATLRYGDGTLAHIHTSWINPRKVRTITVVGNRRMAHWDDVSPFESLRLYDKGIAEEPHYDSFGEFQYLLRNADVHMPHIDRAEPLITQARAFVECVLDGAPCRSGGAEACAVVEVLEAANQSIRLGGRLCPVGNRQPPAAREPATASREETVAVGS